MSRPHTSGGHRAPRAGRGRKSRPSPLSGTSRDAVSRFVRILARCGAAPQDIVREVRTACRGIPKAWATQDPQSTREIGDAAHVLTIWFTELDYLDPFGKPRPLPLEGTRESVTSLVRSVDRRAIAVVEAKALHCDCRLSRVGSCSGPGAAESVAEVCMSIRRRNARRVTSCCSRWA